MNTLAQLVHHLQVFLPQRVEHLQHDLLLELPHASANPLSLLVVGALNRRHNALTQRFLMQGVIFIQPLRYGEWQAVFGLELLLQPGHIPLLLDTHGGNEAIDKIVDHVFANSGDGLRDVIV